MKGIMSAIGAVLSACLASLCCTGPLLLASLGLTGAGALSALERFRPFFFILAVSLLAYSFFKAYRKGPVCCDTDLQKTRIQRISLWVISGLVLSFLLFPFVAAGPKNPPTSVAKHAPYTDTGAEKTITVRVEGMTRPCCEAVVVEAIKKVPGVTDQRVSYAEKKAVVCGTAKLNSRQLVDAINKTGYRASVTPLP